VAKPPRPWEFKASHWTCGTSCASWLVCWVRPCWRSPSPTAGSGTAWSRWWSGRLPWPGKCWGSHGDFFRGYDGITMVGINGGSVGYKKNVDHLDFVGSSMTMIFWWGDWIGTIRTFHNMSMGQRSNSTSKVGWFFHFFGLEISNPDLQPTEVWAARLRVGLGGMNLTTSFPEPKDRDSGALPMGPAELLAHPPFADYVLWVERKNGGAWTYGWKFVDIYIYIIYIVYVVFPWFPMKWQRFVNTFPNNLMVDHQLPEEISLWRYTSFSGTNCMRSWKIQSLYWMWLGKLGVRFDHIWPVDLPISHPLYLICWEGTIPTKSCREPLVLWPGLGPENYIYIFYHIY
jgi:hypothetical protein